MNIGSYSDNTFTQNATITIADSTTFSAAVDCSGTRIAGIGPIPTLTGTVLSFQVSSDGTNYGTLYDSTNTAFSITVASGRSYSDSAIIAMFAAWRYVKVVSGSAEAADRNIPLVMRPV